jgi:hypothetical protein
MDDVIEVPAKKKYKARRKPRRASFQKPVEKTSTATYPGMTENDCAKACSRDRCIISGSIYCAHPRKGGLQAADMGKPDALIRLQQAQKQLGMDKVEKQFA